MASPEQPPLPEASPSANSISSPKIPPGGFSAIWNARLDEMMAKDPAPSWMEVEDEKERVLRKFSKDYPPSFSPSDGLSE